MRMIILHPLGPLLALEGRRFKGWHESKFLDNLTVCRKPMNRPGGIQALVALLMLSVAGCGTFGAMGDTQKSADGPPLVDVRLHGRTRAIQLQQINLSITSYSRGVAYASAKEYDRALQAFNEAIRLNPKHAEAFYGRGGVYLRQNAYDRALQDYDEAIRLNPKHAEAFYARGAAYLGQNAYDRAIENFDQAIGLNPKIGKAYFRRGVAQFDRGQFLASVADFDQAVQLEPTNVYRVIRLYLAQSRTEQDGREHLTSRTSQLDLTQWPGPVVSMYLGTIPSQACWRPRSIRIRRSNVDKNVRHISILENTS